MLDRYIDLINSPTKENIQYDEYSSGTTIDTSIESDSDSQADFYSTFITKYRKTIKHLMSSSQLDEDSSQIETESHMSESFNYDSNNSSFLYSKPPKNQSYHSPKIKPKRNQEAQLFRTISPSSHKQKTRINFTNKKVSTNQQSKKAYEKNRSPSPLPKKIHRRRHSQRKRRRKMEDYLSFDPVFNKYFYLKDKIESSDHEYSDYSYYDYDGYNNQENDDNQIQNDLDTISDLIDSNSMAQNESGDYDDSLQWVETGKVVSRKPHKYNTKANIWEPSLSTPTLKKLNNESRKQKLHH